MSAGAAIRSEPTPDDLVWKALADPTRRRLLDLLRDAPATTGVLARRFELSRFGVMKHLKVLQEAGLVLVERRGRERWNHLNPVPVRGLYRRWIRSFEEEDADRLLRIQRLAEASTEPPPMSTIETSLGCTDILVEVLIEAPLERVWRCMVVETTSWWHADFFTAPSPQGFHIEPQLGGRMFEDWGDGNGQVWGRVEGVRAPEYLQIVGDSSREWGGPSRNIMTWRLSHAGGTTTLRLEHSIFGRISKETETSLTEGWELLFGRCLKGYAETGETPEGAGGD